MIYLFTDFGVRDFYVGQVHSAILQTNPDARVIDLLHEAKPFDIESSARLLTTLFDFIPRHSVMLGVIDPGVGGQRRPIFVKLNDRWLVGPDNGLFSLILDSGRSFQCYECLWRPEYLSNTFHGRDLFAPLAARLDAGEMPEARECSPVIHKWSLDSGNIIYQDHYGNLMTGLSASSLDRQIRLVVGDTEVSYAPRFDSVNVGDVFWTVNSIGLIEIAANQSSAASILNVSVGEEIRLQV